MAPPRHCPRSHLHPALVVAAGVLLLCASGALSAPNEKMGYFTLLAAKTENAAVGFIQVPNTDQYVVASREPLSGGELVGVVDIKGNWVSQGEPWPPSVQ